MTEITTHDHSLFINKSYIQEVEALAQSKFVFHDSGPFNRCLWKC